MTEELGEGIEEAAVEETPIEEAIHAEEEGPPKTIELRPPPPFAEEGLEPFIDYFMQARGLDDRKQAATKLARVLFNIGYNPQREIANVQTYVQNLSNVLAGIPETPETAGVKGSLLATGALDTSNMLKKAHFGQGQDETEEFQKMFRFAQKAKLTMKMLDNIFTGEENVKGSESEVVKGLVLKVERMEKRSEFEQQLNPIRDELKSLSTQIGKLGEKPPGAGEASPEITKLGERVDKLVETIGKQKEADAFTAGFNGLKEEFKVLGDALKAKGGTGSKDATTVFDQAVALMDKISEVTNKYGGSGDGGDADWRAIAISTVGEIGTEAIHAAKEIMTAKGEGEGAEESKVTKDGGEGKAKISQRIIDRKLLGYVQKHVAAGAFQLDSRVAAKELGVSSDDVIDSYKRLRDKGLIVTPGAKKETKPGDSREKPIEDKWIDG